MENQLVVLKLADEFYGVDIAAAEGIINLQPIDAVAQAPHFMEGVTNLRGASLPVINLRKRFGMAPAEATRDTRIIVVKMEGTAVGILVDAVNEVIRVPAEAIQPASPVVATSDAAFISGIANVAGRLIILLDLASVLTGQDLLELKRLVAETAPN